MEIKLSNNEINQIRTAMETDNFLEREVIINERDNPQDFAEYQPYVGDGETTLSNGQRANLKQDTTSEGLQRITITPLKSEAITSEDESVPTSLNSPADQKTEEEILADTIRKLVDPDTI